MTIKRIALSDSTIGALEFDGFRCATLELPDLDNKAQVSCIPAGTYKCKKIVSPSKGNCISITNVPMRSNILIHVGNFTSDVLGCIIVGDSIRDINNDGIPDVTNSRHTFDKLMSITPDEFILKVSQCG